MLKDIATLTGATVISEELGLKLDKVTAGSTRPGQARHVTKDETTIVDGKGKADAIKGRIEMIKGQVEETDCGLRSREAARASCQALRRRRRHSSRRGHRDRAQREEASIEDALSATRAAVQEGMIPGGGASLVHAVKAIDKYEPPKSNGRGATWADEKIGINIVRKALEEPLRQIAENAGFEGSVQVNNVAY